MLELCGCDMEEQVRAVVLVQFQILHVMPVLSFGHLQLYGLKH
jgi:hypothetical protein